MKKFFRPKAWLLIAGTIHAIMGVIVQTVMSNDIAKMGWGDAMAAHDAFYEFLVGLFILPHVAVMFAAAFILSGRAQAKIATILGAATFVNFVGAALHASGNGYMAEMGVIAAFAPPITLFLGLTVSGALHWSEES